MSEPRFHEGEDGTMYLERPNPMPEDQDYGYLLPLTEQAALEAANRIMHEPPPHDEDDVQLVAGYLLQLLSK